MRLLVFQHIECEHPGMLRAFLREDDISWDAVELDEGEPIPALEDYDALWVMGGPMDVWDTEEHPWLAAEKAAIRHWVHGLKKPYLGLCLGHQLLADSLGGACGPQDPPEIGILDVQLTPAGGSDIIFADMPKHQRCLQWHSVCVTEDPSDSTVLVSSSLCRNQAMRVGTNAWSMQYHVELESDTVRNWGDIEAYKTALENSLGPGSLDALDVEAANYMEDFNSNARKLYQNFMNAIR